MCSAAAQGQLWLIDVSQSVDLDHPRALDFLREVRRLWAV
jgi:serine/threonine-protein kinase RIO1